MPKTYEDKKTLLFLNLTMLTILCLFFWLEIYEPFYERPSNKENNELETHTSLIFYVNFVSLSTVLLFGNISLYSDDMFLLYWFLWTIIVQGANLIQIINI